MCRGVVRWYVLMIFRLAILISREHLPHLVDKSCSRDAARAHTGTSDRRLHLFDPDDGVFPCGLGSVAPRLGLIIG